MFTAPGRALPGRNTALPALAAAGLLWGTSVPLSKVALAGIGPGWLTVLRFLLAGVVLLVIFRPRLRSVLTLPVLASGVVGYGGTVLLQNAGVARTSVTHTGLLIGAVPVLVAVLAVIFEKARVRPIAWAGFALSLLGIVAIAATGGGQSTVPGDLLVLCSVVLSASCTLVQSRVLTGGDVIAVSTVQFLAAGVAIAPIAVVTDGLPTPGGSLPVLPLLATVAIGLAGTVLPYTLFAFGQARVPAHVAGAFLNLETLVATVLGVALFGETVTLVQLLGALSLVAGIYVSTVLPAASPVIVADAGPVLALAATGGPGFREEELEQTSVSVFARAA